MNMMIPMIRRGHLSAARIAFHMIPADGFADSMIIMFTGIHAINNIGMQSSQSNTLIT